MTCGAGVGKVVDAVVVVVSVLNAVATTVAVVVALSVGRPHQRALLARVVEVEHPVAVVVLVAGIAEPVGVEVKLRGVGHHGAVVVVVAHAVAVLIGERVDANDFVLPVVDVVEVAVGAKFESHDGRGGGGDLVHVGAALAVGGEVVGDDVAVAVFGNEEMTVVKGDAGGSVKAGGKDAPFNAGEPRVLRQRLEA